MKQSLNNTRLSGAAPVKIGNIRFNLELCVEPKVLEPYEPIGDNVPRKVAINRKQKLYASFNLRELLDQQGIDLNMPHPQVEWLPLELFDDNSSDDFPNEEWIKRRLDEEGRARKLYATIFVKEDGIFEPKRAEITNYENELF